MTTVSSQPSARTHKDFITEASVPKEVLKQFSVIRPGVAAYHVVRTIALIFLSPLVLWAWPHPLAAIATLLITLYAFHSLSQLIHASDHGDLFPNPKLSELTGNFCAHFLGFSRVGHAASHHSHHVYLNTDRDPDRVFLGETDPRRERISGMGRRLLVDLSGVTAVSRLLQYQQTDAKHFDPQPWRRLSLDFLVQAVRLQASVAVVQLVILAYYAVLVGWPYYFLLYVLPLFTIYPAQCRIRFFVEHAFDHGYAPQTDDEVWITRTTKAPLWERFLMSPLGMPYHFEHHLLPSVPYYNLPAVHRYLLDKGVRVPVAEHGYLAFILKRWAEERGPMRSPALGQPSA